MKYHCRDCSYRGNAAGQSGECPACGSYTLVRSNRQEDAAPPSVWRIVLLIGLWAYLLILIARKLNT